MSDNNNHENPPAAPTAAAELTTNASTATVVPPTAKKAKLAKLGGKNRREGKPQVTQYDEHGNWITIQSQRHEKLRLVSNAQFDRYYNELQNLGQVEADRLALLNTTNTTSGVVNATGDEGDASAAAVSAAALWVSEMKLFRTPLNTTVWVNDTDPLAGEVRAFFERQGPGVVEEIPWYPIKGMAWRILADKTTFRKRPDMQELRRFLIRQTALGTISRQEEVSMIPPFLLDIQNTDVCLDMCASPGSKTAQMLCALGRHKVVPFESTASPFPFDYESEGLIVANELDSKRANMLVHQVKRLRLLFPFALFTNHDARYFPEIMLDATLPSIATPLPVCPETGSPDVTATAPMRFDKILCDVVCSGDGTLRKAPHVFRSWSPKEGMALQRLQIHIALRACHLLKVGGRLVYSTCSLNPIENEAVVAQLIHRTKGAMKLVDVRGQLLPNLVCAPGMRRWTVTDARGNVATAPGPQLHEALFPPNTADAYASPAVDACDLSLCMRLFPSHCDGGGFFIAVLDKVSEYRIEKRDLEDIAAEEKEKQQQQQQHSGGGKATSASAAGGDGEGDTTAHVATAPGTKRGREDTEKSVAAPAHNDGAAPVPAPASFSSGEGEEEPPVKKKLRVLPPQFVAPPAEVNAVMRDFYDITGGGGPTFPTEYLVMRTSDGERTAGTMKPNSTCAIVARSARRVLAQKQDSLIVVSAGLRVFAFESLDKGWRIASEAAVLFAKMMAHSRRLLPVPVAFVQRLITHGGKMKEMLYEDMEDLALRESIEALSLGALLLRIDAPAAVGGVLYSVALRARQRVQLLVDHEDLVGMQLRLGLEPEVGQATEEEGGDGEAVVVVVEVE